MHKFVMGATKFCRTDEQAIALLVAANKVFLIHDESVAGRHRLGNY